MEAPIWWQAGLTKLCGVPSSPSCLPSWQVYVTPEELRQIKGAGEGGMTLLGFKPLRWAPQVECHLWAGRCERVVEEVRGCACRIV